MMKTFQVDFPNLQKWYIIYREIKFYLLMETNEQLNSQAIIEPPQPQAEDKVLTYVSLRSKP